MPENNNRNLIPADEAVHDLTLALLYLTRFAEDQGKKDLWAIDSFRAWKSYAWNALNKLVEEELIIDRHGNKSLWITEEGVIKAREILNRLGISDWEARKKGKHCLA